ncbi:MAG: radical SAM protein, partial [Firmicutes bacterium]|nr:radical SAM protein [Bacillota bacterium]
MQKLGIYIHIPFCLRKCPYCDFYSTASHDKETRERFLSALCKEISFYGGRYGKDREVDTVFFGGGTPSILEAGEVCRIMSELRRNYHIEEAAEISMECNPATASYEKLEAYRAAGVNRLSIGAQSFDDDVLKTLGRLHDVKATRETV